MNEVIYTTPREIKEARENAMFALALDMKIREEQHAKKEKVAFQQMENK